MVDREIRSALFRKLVHDKPMTLVFMQPSYMSSVIRVLDLLAVHQEMRYPLKELAVKAGISECTCRDIVKHLVEQKILVEEADAYGLFPRSTRARKLIEFIAAIYDDLIDERAETPNEK